MSGGNGEIKKVSEISWSTISGNIRAEAQRIVSGNSDYDSIINEFYKPYQEDDNIAYKENKLVDIESFLIPSNIKSVPFSRPASDLLDAYVRPDMNDAFKKSVLRQIGNRASRNISFGSSNIEKDGAIDRLLISIYHITFTYGENTFSLYASGDGKKIKLEGIPPIDNNRKKELETLNQEYESIDGSVSFFTLGVIALIVIMLILFCAVNFVGLVIIPLIILCIYKSIPARKKRTELKEKIDQFNKQIELIKNDFITNNKKIKNYKDLEI